MENQIASVNLNTGYRETIDSFKLLLKPINVKRGVHKRQITLLFKHIDANVSTCDEMQQYIEEINEHVKQIKILDEEITHLFVSHDIVSVDAVFFDNEVDSRTNYHIDIKSQIIKCKSVIGSNTKDVHEGATSNTPLQRLEAMPPSLSCQIFYGDRDRYDFKSFLAQFDNLIGCKNSLTNSAKLQYLKSYLRGNAYRLIKHLSNSDENYEIALALLKKEFLDEARMINDIFLKIVNAPKTSNSDFEQLNQWLCDVRALLLEMRNSDLDFFIPESPGCLLMSHIVVSKLPSNFLKELILRCGSCYPNINQILEHFNHIIKSLSLTKLPHKREEYGDSKYTFKGNTESRNTRAKSSFTTLNEPKSKGNLRRNVSQSTRPAEVPLSSFYASDKNLNNQNVCKFCSSNAHRMTTCIKYKTPEERIERCKAIGLCTMCSSDKHLDINCPGKKFGLSFKCVLCAANSHITALCVKGKSDEQVDSSPRFSQNNLCINTSAFGDQNFLLPTLTLGFTHRYKRIEVRCLLDLGSQRSYLHSDLLKEFDINPSYVSEYDCSIKTFNGQHSANVKESLLRIHLDADRNVLHPLLFSDLNLDFNVENLKLALNNIKAQNVQLADTHFRSCSKDEVENIQGLLGTDILQFMYPFSFSRLLNGSIIEVAEGVIPFGNVDNFLSNNQLKTIIESKKRNASLRDRDSIINMNRSLKRADENIVQSVLNPINTYFTPFQYVSSVTDIEQGMENLFKLENLGIREEDDVGSLDKVKVKQFQESITFSDGKYQVELPWYDDLISQVPPNHNIAMATLHRVIKNLHSKDLFDKYDSVFKQHEADGIIEKIKVEPSDYANHIWIPHRAVVKEAAQVTTKVRPVFNCSLKINSLPSLNEASYPGIDLMSSLFRILCNFRSNDYVLLSDVKQAFLNIKLKLEADRNRFCFFWVDNGKVVTYRYTTIVFGLAASPFILNYVLKHHVKNYPNDVCSQVLNRFLYVDNLIYTHYDREVLKDVYAKSVDRLNEGGFELRSWNSNDASLTDLFHSDGRGVSHSEEVEKVLGYSYNIANDSLSLNDFNLDCDRLTKRKLLSLTSKVFDPLSLYSPVTVKSRLFLRQTWISQLGWDDFLPEELNFQCLKHFRDLEKLKQISFERKAFSTDCDNLTLNVFCDASSSCYGFVIYVKSDSENSLLFTKTKIAPLKERTLPSLELLSVFLAFKHLPQILSSFDVNFKAINVFVDAQIVLSWLLSGKIKTKQMFIRNRLQDITRMMENLRNDHNVTCKYFYVPSEENPADMLTRGISFKEFEKGLEFWKHGPYWLNKEPVHWPKNNLGCLSETSKTLTPSSTLISNVITHNEKSTCLIDISKYSDIRKVERIATYVFKFVSKLRKKDIDPGRMAKIYLIKNVQAHCFKKEILFLKENKSNTQIPDLVKNLNLFLDQDGILRSKGRISKVNYYDYEVLNPILLPKEHSYSRLIIRKAHFSCKHLGVQSTLNKVRLQGYWIPKARQIIKTVLSECIICKKYNNFAFAYPKYTSFTKAQMDYVRPFKHVGVDFTGHILVKSPDSSVTTKMFILIYTCLNTRAIHIDLLKDMSTKSFILSFQRFSNLFGVCDTIYSDNAKYFSQGAKIFEQFLVSDEFKEELRASDIKHVRIPVYASWVGSLWERMIRTIKNCIHKTIGRSILDYFDMVTLLSNIQNSINSRPLTYISSDDEMIPLTPNSFFKHHDTSCIDIRIESDRNDPIWEKDPPSRQRIILSLNKINEKFDYFKSLWYQEYLLSLRERSRDLFQSEWYNKVRIGDVVLIKHPSKSRPYWKMGMVIQLILGEDNRARFVKLRKADGSEDVYAIKLLYPLEIHANLNHSNLSNDDSVSAEPDIKSTRVKRKAAQAAMEKIKIANQS